jgi:hypothetical protein
MMKWTRDDGGRRQAGHAASIGDCVCRSIAIGTGLPYEVVWRLLRSLGRSHADRGAPQYGCEDLVWRSALELLSYRDLGEPTTVLRDAVATHDGIGTYSILVPGHMTTLVDGVIHDTRPPRGGTVVESIWCCARRWT